MSLEDAVEALLNIDHELNDEDEDNLFYLGTSTGKYDNYGTFDLTLDYADEEGDFGGNVETYTVTITPKE